MTRPTLVSSRDSFVPVKFTIVVKDAAGKAKRSYHRFTKWDDDEKLVRAEMKGRLDGYFSGIGTLQAAALVRTQKDVEPEIVHEIASFDFGSPGCELLDLTAEEAIEIATRKRTRKARVAR